MLEANNTLLNNPQVKKEITKEILKYSEFNENENTHINNYLKCKIGRAHV